jgi:hypothetical protein
MNWSPDVYHIGESLVQKNQHVLYKLVDGPERRFVREELMVVDVVNLSPKYVLNL